jgi:hypothetical protein
MPFAERLDVHGADVRVAFAEEFGCEMSAYEPARARD